MNKEYSDEEVMQALRNTAATVLQELEKAAKTCDDSSGLSRLTVLASAYKCLIGE